MARKRSEERANLRAPLEDLEREARLLEVVGRLQSRGSGADDDVIEILVHSELSSFACFADLMVVGRIRENVRGGPQGFASRSGNSTVCFRGVGLVPEV